MEVIGLLLRPWDWMLSLFGQCKNLLYYSFKILPRFWLVKTTRIIHHNQLLFTKFGKNLRHIESITSKVQPAADYWTVDRENLRARLCYCWCEQKNKERNGETPLGTGKYFEWIIKQLLNSAFVLIWRILQISEGVIHLGLRPLWITPSLICRILHILLSLIP